MLAWIDIYKERFTKWFYHKGYRMGYRDKGPGFSDVETVFRCPLWLKPIAWIMLSPSVYHAELGQDLYEGFIEGYRPFK